MNDTHTHNTHGMGHGSAQTYLRRFLIVTFLLIVVANAMLLKRIDLG